MRFTAGFSFYFLLTLIMRAANATNAPESYLGTFGPFSVSGGVAVRTGHSLGLSTNDFRTWGAEIPYGEGIVDSWFAYANDGLASGRSEFYSEKSERIYADSFELYTRILAWVDCNGRRIEDENGALESYSLCEAGGVLGGSVVLSKPVVAEFELASTGGNVTFQGEGISSTNWGMSIPRQLLLPGSYSITHSVSVGVSAGPLEYPGSMQRQLVHHNYLWIRAFAFKLRVIRNGALVRLSWPIEGDKFRVEKSSDWINWAVLPDAPREENKEWVIDAEMPSGGPCFFRLAFTPPGGL